VFACQEKTRQCPGLVTRAVGKGGKCQERECLLVLLVGGMQVFITISHIEYSSRFLTLNAQTCVLDAEEGRCRGVAIVN
jgi:hypothetical protein